jgi:hypothetical protein
METSKKYPTIYRSAKFFFYISKMFGLAPYSFDESDLRFKMGFWNYGFLFLSTSTWFTISCCVTKKLIETGLRSETESKVMDTLFLYHYILQHFLIVFSMVFNFLKRKHVESFFKFIFEFDSVVEKLGWNFKVSHSKFFILVMFLISFIFMISYNFVALYNLYFEVDDPVGNFEKTLSSFIYVFLSEHFFMVSMQFICSCYCVYARLSALLRNARSFLPLNEGQVENVRLSPFDEKFVLQKIGVLYDVLYDAADNINSVFSKTVGDLLIAIHS